MKNQTIAINVERFRKRLKLTKKQLAESAGISLSYMKSIGKSEPRMDTLKKLSMALSVPIVSLLTPPKKLDYIRFRTLKRAEDSDILINDIAIWLDNYNGLLAMMDKIEPHVEIRDIQPSSPEKAAQAVRAKLGIKPNEPIYDILGLVDKFGIKVRLVEIKESGFFGLSVGEKSGGPAIIVNSHNISIERQIFTVAHELGHLVLHKKAYTKNPKENKKEEKEADIFAAELLLPQKAFESQWNASIGSEIYDRIIKIKVIFKVSFFAVLYRVSEHLKRDYSELLKEMSYVHFRRNGTYINRKIEIPPRLKPNDFLHEEKVAPFCKDPMFDEALPRYTIECLRKNRITLSRASEILDGKPIKDIEALLSVK